MAHRVRCSNGLSDEQTSAQVNRLVEQAAVSQSELGEHGHSIPLNPKLQAPSGFDPEQCKKSS